MSRDGPPDHLANIGSNAGPDLGSVSIELRN
jgi:hypothetical protein